MNYSGRRKGMSTRGCWREIKSWKTTSGVFGVASSEVKSIPWVPMNRWRSWAIFNVGDSRVLHIHEGEIKQVTVDHSEVQDMVTLGILAPEEAAVHPMRHIVTRSLGARPDVQVDVERLEVVPGDRLLVCSDGLTDEVSPDDIFWVLDTAQDPQHAADALIQAALAAGGHDNVTVVVVDIVAGD